MEQLLALLKSVTMPDGSVVDLSQNAILLDALKKGIAHGSQTKKDKLYPEIERLKLTTKTQVPTSPANGVAFEDLLRSLQTQNNTPNPQPNPTVATQPQQGVSKEDIATMVADMFNTKVPEILAQQLAPFTAQLTAIQAETVESYRARKLSELGDSVIPEMVNGNSKEAIDASIEVAKTVMSRFRPAQQAAEPQQQAAEPQQQAATTAPLPNSQPNVQGQQQQQSPPPSIILPNSMNTGGVDANSVKGMDRKDYASNRDALMKSLASLLPQ